MTAAFDDRQTEPATPAMAGAGGATVGGWLADPWPKAAIAFGFALTAAWGAFLLWCLSFVPELF